MTDGSNYLTGVGQTIHIADFNCNDNHKVYDNKTIYNLMTVEKRKVHLLMIHQIMANTNKHMVAGDNPASYTIKLLLELIIGVAPDADLVYHLYLIVSVLIVQMILQEI